MLQFHHCPVGGHCPLGRLHCKKNAFLKSVSKKWFVLLFYNEEELSGLKLILSMSWHLHNLSPSSLKYLIEDYFHLFTIFANLLDELLWRQSGVFHKVGFHPFFAIGEWNNLILKEVHFYKRDQFSSEPLFVGSIDGQALTLH